MRKPASILISAVLIAAPAFAGAAGENTEDLACTGGQFQPCTDSSQCADYPLATLCIDDDFFDASPGQCQIPCQDEKGNPVPKECAIGETCVMGKSDTGDAHFCKRSRFVMDLNLLDTCIKHFVDNLATPGLAYENDCSLTSNLNQMLDQDGNNTFDIFDVDLCIKEFLAIEETPCVCDGLDPADQGLVYAEFLGDWCDDHSDCPDPDSVCDPARNECKIEPWQAHRSEPCERDEDCPHIDEVCDQEQGHCRQECWSNSDCGSPSLSCNLETRYCECNRPNCDNDRDIDPYGTIDRVFCITDEECGQGLFCDEALHFCRRECGLVVNRASSDAGAEVLNRTCFGNLKVCNPYRGRCERIDPTQLSCVVDTDCPSGSYCFVGECAPKCFTSIDCPDAKWYCARNNSCQPVPMASDGDAEAPFDPMDYAILFADRKVSLSTINDEYEVPLLIMNKASRKQVFDDPTVVFGFRLETSYIKKQSEICMQSYDALFQEEKDACRGRSDEAQCLADITDQANRVIDDCEIGPDEEWITLKSPFGTLYGDGDPTIDLSLNYGAIELLSPGLYMAKLKAIFNNGQTDEITIKFNKQSPNGDYVGSVKIYKNGSENVLAEDILKMKLFIDLDAAQIEWDRDILGPNNMLVEREYIDVTSGFPVTGYIDGNAAVVFDNPLARTRKENERIPVKGLYSPSLGRMRLTAVIDLSDDASACRSEDGDCSGDDPHQLKVENIFDRKIRRIIEFIGPFDYRLGRFNGGYRETISGLAPAHHDITLEGEFTTELIRQEDAPIQIPEPLVPHRVDEQGNLLPPQSVGFVDRYELIDMLTEITGVCAQWETFQTPEAYDRFIAQFGGVSFYENMIRFEGEIGRALTELGNDPQDYLTLSEYLKGTIEFCPETASDVEGEPTEDRILNGPELDTEYDDAFEEDDYEDGLTCINRQKVACGLAFYRKVLLAMRSPNPEGREETCATDRQCPAGQFCVDGACQCTDTTGCDFDGDAENDMACIFGKCRCENSSQCGDLACVRGECVCTANDDCPLYQVCSRGQCVCGSNDACGDGQVCDEGACVCAEDAACDVGQTCDPERGCVCETDDGCGGADICNNGYCECDPMYPEESCGPGWLCRNGECRCDEADPDACGEGRTCEAGVCACSDDSGCGMNEFCNAEARVCQGLDEGWVDLQTVGQSEHFNSYTLFCPDIPLEGSDCLIPPGDNPALYALHEHNRFFKEMVQTLSYQAGNALSDAFYVMYKAYQGDALDADSAYEHKELRLYQALDSYEQLRKELFGPVNTAILFQWPMRWFATIGNSFLDYMHTATNDRLETMTDLIDLRRRILRDTNEQDYIFIHHVLHEDYLTRVFLFVLQEYWQKELFMYTGESQEMLELGKNLLNRVNERRNPLGHHPNRVYFENADVNLNNWQNYRKRAEQELQKAETSVASAITEMKNALRDKDNLEASLQTAAHQFDATIEQMCGPASWYPDECDVSLEEREAAWSCDPLNPDGSECEEWLCETTEDDIEVDRCLSVYKSFNNAIGASDQADPADRYACRVNSERYVIETNNDERLCVRGQMGAMLQEELTLKEQIKQTFQEVEMLSRQIGRETEFLTMTQRENEALREYLGGQQDDIDTINASVRTIQSAFDAAREAANAIGCTMIVGLSSGGDCPNKGIATAILVGAIAGKNVSIAALQTALDTHSRNKSERLQSANDDAQIRQLRNNLDHMAAQWENHVLKYQMLVQQLFNTQMRIQDTHYLAKRTAARYNDVVGSIVDRLIGRESGSVLLRNKMVEDANRRFQNALDETYKTVQAFTYRYNYGDQVHTTANKVFALQTVDDIRDFLADLDYLEQDYCGRQGLDCDFGNNTKVFRMSLRETLFPQYRDIISNGRVLTAGEQFHNTITSSLFAIKRNRASGIKRQIELPINVWVNRGGGAAGEDGYMVNPEECNHFIVGKRNGGAATAGTIAVNVMGTRLGKNVEYELWRNNTDYVRACSKGGLDPEYPTNIYTVGWAPQNENADLDNPDTFLTHSQTFTACQNNRRLEDPNTVNQEDTCYNYFARDRSLGTQDMTLVIPAVSDRQRWLLGDGLPDEEKPIIEDVILYFRYSSEPIYSDGN